MDDRELVELFNRRDPQALEETEKQYGTYCLTIARNILHTDEDADECVNDVYMQAWKSIPPDRPNSMKAYLGCIARNAAIDRLRRLIVKKRGEGAQELPMTELEEVLPGDTDIEDEVIRGEVRRLLNSFIGSLKREDRILFVQRYWYMLTIPQLAERHGMSQSKIKMRLMRTRKKLREYL